MKKLILTTVLAVAHVAAHAQETGDSLTVPYRLDEVVVTGTRQPASMRHLPVSLTVIDSQTLPSLQTMASSPRSTPWRSTKPPMTS